MELVDFGKTGFRVPRLSIGTGTHGAHRSSEQTKLGIDGLADLLVQAADLGVTFWDTADQYGAHPHVAEALRRVHRDQITLATKTHASNAREAGEDVDRFLKELGTDVLDIVLLHGLHHRSWPRKYEGAMEGLARTKEQGKVRSVGFSCHGLGALRAAVSVPWVDVVLVRINYAGVNMDGKPSEVEPVIADLYAAGKAIYGMKVLGCGPLTHDVRRAIEYVLGLGTVHAMTIGMSHLSHVQQAADLVDELAPQHAMR